MVRKELVLVIESAVRGGSLSLLKDFTEIGFWVGQQLDGSRSEDVLAEINRLLKKCNLSKTQIKKIIVSNGQGSSTGFRIGKAIGIGLRKAINCGLEVRSVLQAMASTFLPTEGLSRGERIIAAVPFGRNQVYWQSFYQENIESILESKIPEFGSFDDFAVFCNKINFRCRLIMHQKLFEEFCLRDINSNKNVSLYNAGDNLAALMGRASMVKKFIH